MKAHQYRFRARGAQGKICGLSAGKAHAIVREIERGNEGSLTPEAVVEAAEPPDHPLHSCFDWNDSSAGRKYRLIQARTLIRSIEIVLSDGDEELRTPVFLHLNPGGGAAREYRHVTQFAGRADDLRLALADLLRRADSILAAVHGARTAAGAKAAQDALGAAAGAFDRGRREIEKAAAMLK